jgi:Uma2 family endonuclease
MSVAQSPVPATILPQATDEVFLLTGMSWNFYEQLLAEIGDRPIRVTYDQGRLELMAPSYLHEGYSRAFSLLIGVAAEEFDLPIKGAGSTTFRRADLLRGLEPDQCFYIQHVADILGKTELDLTVDPPPDLAFEVDLTRRALDRMEIYAALGVPEVWRYNGRKLRVFLLNEAGQYQEQSRSPTFPRLPLSEFIRLLPQSLNFEETSLRKEFRAWIRALPPDAEKK